MKLKKKIFFSLLTLFVFSSLISIRSFASELNFSVQTDIPENQVNKKKTYFDLLMTPNQKQDVTITLKNDTDRAVIVEAKPYTATTNNGGIVEYGASKTAKDSSLKHDLKELLDLPEELTIPAKSSVKLPITIQMPKEAFKGSLAGGITLHEKPKEEIKNEEDNSKGLAIDNLYSYIVAIVVREDLAAITPNINLTKVSPEQKNYRNVIQANLQNDTATFINQLKLQAKITKKGQSDVLYEHTNEHMQMAPNSNFNFSTPLNGDTLKPGVYTLQLEGTSKDNHWQWQEDFTITADVAKKFNKTDVSIKKNVNWLLYLVIALLIIFIVLLLLVLLKKKKETTDN